MSNKTSATSTNRFIPNFESNRKNSAASSAARLNNNHNKMDSQLYSDNRSYNMLHASPALAGHDGKNNYWKAFKPNFWTVNTAGSETG